MKTIPTLLLGAAGLVLAHSASAALPSVVRIVGSNGDRVATTQAVLNLLSNATYTAGIAGSATASNFSNITGTYAGQTITVQTSFIGATGGIKAVAGAEEVRFLPLSATGTSNANPQTSSNPSQYLSAVPDFGVSTNFQSTSPYLGEYQGKNYIELKETLTGVVALNFLGSFGFPGDNFTTAQAQTLYKNGRVPLAFFTGNSTDRNKTVFAVGRNFDAGQRYGSLAEFGLGVNAVTKHYQPVIAGNGTVTSHALWPIETISGESSLFLGNSGYNSGANLVAALNTVLSSAAYTVGNPSATAGYYIGYLTPNDAATATNHGTRPAKLLKWNGITYSPAALKEGQYTAWVYTRVIYDPAIEGTDVGDFADAIANEVSTTTIALPSSGGIKLSELAVSRSAEGAPVTANYF